MTPRAATTHIVVHTAAGSQDATAEDIRRLHVDVNGWADIGYHFVVRHDGTMDAGRRVDLVGAHARGYNDRSIGVCFAGHHDREPWSPEAAEVGVRLIATLCTTYGVPVVNVIGHRETGARKTCPGTMVDMDDVRAMIAAHPAYRVDP